jgi:hypothetical protein
MELSLKEMAQIERAKQDAAKKEEERIYNERMKRLRELRDELLRELLEFIPNAYEGRYVRPSIFIPLKEYPTKGGIGYSVFPLEDGRLEIDFHSPSCCLKDHWHKFMTRKEFAEKVLSQYV